MPFKLNVLDVIGGGRRSSFEKFQGNVVKIFDISWQSLEAAAVHNCPEHRATACGQSVLRTGAAVAHRSPMFAFGLTRLRLPWPQVGEFEVAIRGLLPDGDFCQTLLYALSSARYP